MSIVRIALLIAFIAVLLSVLEASVDSRRVRRMRRWLRARTPEEMTLEWDRRITALRGFAVVEGEREEKMAMELAEQLRRHGTVLAVVDMPRVDGILERLARHVGE